MKGTCGTQTWNIPFADEVNVDLNVLHIMMMYEIDYHVESTNIVIIDKGFPTSSRDMEFLKMMSKPTSHSNAKVEYYVVAHAIVVLLAISWFVAWTTKKQGCL
jgi:hypothetical protein